MPLESANQPYQLVATNPPTGDAALQGHLHLQLIKQMMLLGYLGQISDIATVRALTAPVGATFMYNFGYYQINDNFFGSTVVENTSKMIHLNNGRRAYRIDNRFWFGQFQGQDPIRPANNNSFRYPVCRRITGAGTVFPIADATASVPASTPVLGDIVEYTTGSGSTRLTETCYWNGSVWQRVPNEINGLTYVHGLFAASRVQTVDVLAGRVRTGVSELVGTTNMEIRNPDGFGPDNLTYWFGPVKDKLNGNGDVLYSTLTKLSAFRWQALSTTGGVTEGEGGENVPDPTPPTTGGAVPNNFGMGTSYASTNYGYWDNPVSEVCGFLVGTNGSITFVHDGFEAIGEPASGAYVTTLAPNVGALYEMRVTLNSGVLNDGLLPSFTPLNVSRFVRNIAYATPSDRTQTRLGEVTITIREIANPTNTKSLVVSFLANAICQDGFTP